MLLEREREEIVRACRKLSAAGLVVGTAGNVSVLAGDLVAVTPSGVDYAELAARDVGVHRLDGTPVEAPLAPTSELPLHLAVYGAYAGAGTAAIVHTHSVAATAVATLADELPPIHYYVAMFGGTVRVAPYATYGTDELASNAVQALRGRTACLLGSHGAVTTGQDLKTAYDRSVYLEWVCDVYLRAAAAGTPRLLPPGEIEAVAAKLARLRPAPLESSGVHALPGLAPCRPGDADHGGARGRRTHGRRAAALVGDPPAHDGHRGRAAGPADHGPRRESAAHQAAEQAARACGRRAGRHHGGAGRSLRTGRLCIAGRIGRPRRRVRRFPHVHADAAHRRARAHQRPDSPAFP